MGRQVAAGPGQERFPFGKQSSRWMKHAWGVCCLLPLTLVAVGTPLDATQYAPAPEHNIATMLSKGACETMNKVSHPVVTPQHTHTGAGVVSVGCC